MLKVFLKIKWQIWYKVSRFWEINWLPIHERVSQCSLGSIYKFFTKNCPNYFDEINVPVETNGAHTRSSCQKLNVPYRKTNVGQKGLS